MKSVASQLTEFIRDYPMIPFDWATHNCVHFAADWLGKLCQGGGELVLPPFRDKQETRRFFVEQQATFAELVTKYSGLTEIEPFRAVVGDIVLATKILGQADYQVLGIHNGNCAAFLGEDGKIVFGAVPIMHAWSVVRAS